MRRCILSNKRNMSSKYNKVKVYVCREENDMVQEQNVKKVAHVFIFSRPKTTDSVREVSVPRYPNGKVTS